MAQLPQLSTRSSGNTQELPQACGGAADVCLIVEGCYPHVAGGVSTWVDWLMRSQPDTTFSVISIVGSSEEDRQILYSFPNNLIHFAEIPLWGASEKNSSDKVFISITRWLARHPEQIADDILEQLLPFLHSGGSDRLSRLIKVVRQHNLSLRELTELQLAWRIVSQAYNREMKYASFLSFYWAWRCVVGGLFAVLSAPLPVARLYHTVATGFAGLLAARAAIETRARTIITEHGIYTNERRIEILMADWIDEKVDKGFSISDSRPDLRDFWITAFKAFGRACYETCDQIISLYRDNQRLQRDFGARSDKLTVIPNGIDTARYEGIIPIGKNRRPTMALIGRVVPIKDVKTFIAAVNLVRRSVPSLSALILGPLDEDPDYAAECKELTASLTLADTVLFTGRVDITHWLPSIDVVVLTSLSEAQPLTLLEAGAASIPCVTTNVGACREILLGRDDEHPNKGAGGIVTDVVAPGQIAEAVIKLLSDQSLLRQMGERLRSRVLQFYTSELAATAYRELYGRYCIASEGTAWQA
jgi:polysaccharide biosynthesis protein PelF